MAQDVLTKSDGKDQHYTADLPGAPEDKLLTTLLDLDDPLFSYSPSRYKTTVLCLVCLFLGIVQTLPLAILIPESLDLGLTAGSASLIVAAWPAASLLVLVIQPPLNKINSYIYISLCGLLYAVCSCSFYLLITLPTSYFLVLAVVARFLSGTALFLINNKTAVILTSHVRQVDQASCLWEVFNSAGQASGAYLGSWLCARFQEWAGRGFSLTMCTAGGVLVVVVVVVMSCDTSGDEVGGDEEVPLSEVYKMFLSRELLVYCWCPSVCIGGCMVWVEGILSQFYREQYDKSLRFGAVLLGTSGILYTVSASVFGLLRQRWKVLTILGLILGLVGAGTCLIFLGPLPSLPFPLYFSTSSFLLLLLFSCAIQLNSLTLSSLSLSLDPHLAMSVSLNAVNVAYNLGAFVGPVVAGNLVAVWGYRVVFSSGTVFFWLAAGVVSVYHVTHHVTQNRDKGYRTIHNIE